MSGLRQDVFVTKHACVDAYVGPRRDTVVAFTITVSDPRFQFNLSRLTFGTYRDVRLGRSRFGDAQRAEDVDEVMWWNGARYTGYAEAYYGANPAGLQAYVLAYLPSGVGDLAHEQVPEPYIGGC